MERHADSGDGSHVEYWLNGVRVVEYALWSEDWEARVAASKFSAYPNSGARAAGISPCRTTVIRCSSGTSRSDRSRAAATPRPARASDADGGPRQALRHDVPPVLRLGGVVRDDGHLPRRDTGVSGQQIGLAYGTTRRRGDDLPFFIGMVADRYFATERSWPPSTSRVRSCSSRRRRSAPSVRSMRSCSATRCCTCRPLALTNSLSFHQMQDPGKEFPAVRVLGTIGWIVAGLTIGFLHLESTAVPNADRRWRLGGSRRLLSGAAAHATEARRRSGHDAGCPWARRAAVAPRSLVRDFRRRLLPRVDSRCSSTTRSPTRS